MRRIRSAIAAALMALVCAQTCVAGQRDPVQLDIVELQRLMREQIAWIGAHTKYRVDDVGVPEIVFRPSQELARMFYGGNPPENSSQSHMFVALYSNGTLSVSAEFDVLRQPYRLLHEVVHHVQFRRGVDQNGEPWVCPGDKEVEAYHLQGEYSKDLGLTNGDLPADLSNPIPDEFTFRTIACSMQGF